MNFKSLITGLSFFLCLPLILSGQDLPCYQVDALLADINGDVSVDPNSMIGSTFNLNLDVVQIGDSNHSVINNERSSERYRDALQTWADCQYYFEDLPREVNIVFDDIKIIQNKTLGNQLSMAHVRSELGFSRFIIIRGYLFNVSICGDEQYCMADVIRTDILGQRAQRVEIIQDIDEISIVQAEYETVTEEVLDQEASSSIEAIPAVFEEVYEIVLAGEKLVCDDYEPQWDTIYQQVIMREASLTIEVIDAKYETVIEEVLLAESRIHIEIDSVRCLDSTIIVVICEPYRSWSKNTLDLTCFSSDPLDCISWNWVDHPGVYDTLDVEWCDPCALDFTSYGKYCVKRNEVPALYETRSYEKLLTPATTQSTPIDADSTILTSIFLSNSDQIPESCIVPIYDTLYWQKLVQPATTVTTEIPAEYSDRSYQKLIVNGSAIIEPIEAGRDTTYQVKYRVRPNGGIVDSIPVICPLWLDNELWADVRTALDDLGYYTGQDETTPNPHFLNGLTEFQFDHQLTIGSLTTQTLEALGVDFGWPRVVIQTIPEVERYSTILVSWFKQQVLRDGSCANREIHHYKKGGDLMVGDRKYSELTYADHLTGDVLGVDGYIYESPDYSQLYIYDAVSQLEHLTFDLSLGPCDTFYITHAQDRKTIAVPVLSVDYINFKKVIELDIPIGFCPELGKENLKFIEGVGPNANLNYQVRGDTVRSYLFCHFDENQLRYTNELFNGNCAPVLTHVEEDVSPSYALIIYPNPVMDALKIQRSSQRTARAEVYNLSGQKIGSYMLNSNLEALNVSALGAGLYIIVVNDGEDSFVRKFIKG